ncbi:nidogennidogen-2 [Podarcis lilfordi]|uniref:Nidogennidogen-2 n=2 Tax=Podarcis lilfordi TaxID=74358 RepID=A0AA35JRJ1_9SAUR|nr:nidogennidogen-2 [Podarcis lilfordi]
MLGEAALPGLFLLLLLQLPGWGAALPRAQLFPFGPPRGDRQLPDGDDETSAPVQLPSPLLYYETRFSQVYVGTNGIISTQDFPRETQYVDDDFPTDFPAVAPFLSDIDTSGGRGKIYYRLDDSREVTDRAAQLIQAGFPSADGFAPRHTFIATWENVGAYEEVSRNSEPSKQHNTFQAVLAYSDSDAYALFLYPEDGVQFFGTRPKESYNVHLELPARVGFSRGDYQRREGPYHSVTSSEQSVKNLYQLSNMGIPGVWAFHIGSATQLGNVVPASLGGLPAAPPELPETSSTGHNFLEPEYPDPNLDYADPFYDDSEDDFEYLPVVPTGQPLGPGPSAASNADAQVDYSEPRHSGASLDSELEPTSLYSAPSSLPPYSELDSALLYLAEQLTPPSVLEENARTPSLPPVYESPIEAVTAVLLRRRGDGDSLSPQGEGTSDPMDPDIFPDYPEGEVILESFPDTPPFSHRRRVVGVDEDLPFDPDGFTYSTANVETCEDHHHQCSLHSFCTDYSTGFCCHCQSKFYGNGRHCLPEGAAHRLNGKVSGDLLVGRTPLRFGEVDMHAYIVGNDGRAYTAISHIPQPAARSLMPLAPIGGFFGWLFALEKPGYKNGFRIAGAKFTHHFEATFYPGEEKVSVKQTADGLDAENYLSVRTKIQGQVPYIPEDFTVHIAPFKEIYHYSDSVVTSTSYREYSLVSGNVSQTFSYRLHQNITYQECQHAHHRRLFPAAQQLTVDRIFALYNEEESVLRYAVTNQIGPLGEDSGTVTLNPCYDGTHSCDTTARCQPGSGLDYSCECSAGYWGDGKECADVNECQEGRSRCSPESVCVNTPGSYRCECPSGYQIAGDRATCVAVAPPSDPCTDGTHTCAPSDQARCVYHGGGSFSCVCLTGYAGNGHNCTDVDECAERRCHQAADCYNSPGSFSCRCFAGYEGDGFRCSPGGVQRMTRCEHERLYASQRGAAFPGAPHVPECDDQGNYRPLQCHSSTGYCWCVDTDGKEIPGSRVPPSTSRPTCRAPEPTQRPQTMCERWRQSLLEHYGGSPRGDQYVPQCDALGEFTPLQCHGNSGYCWCVDEHGREVQGTRSEPGVPPACLPSVAPPTVRPSPRPDVSPPSAGTFLLYAQGQQIGYLPLNGTRLHKEAAKTLLSLHGSIVVGIDYDCREKMMYWTDVAGRTISRASLEQGAEPETIIQSGLMSPEGLAIDHLRRTMFWTDSGLDKIESARLDGTERRVLFATDLVNPRAITVDPIHGNLYWTDWNREAPKIETSTVTGEHRRILVNQDIGLPNGLTFDPFSKLICWADAGTKKLECALPNGTGRRVIQNHLNYPFSIVSYANHFYHTDWRRDGVIAVNKDSGAFTGEYLPEQRTHLYGITAVHPYCPGGRK